MDIAGALAVSLARLKLMKPGIDQVFLCNSESVHIVSSYVRT